jgi:hypothetical protein
MGVEAHVLLHGVLWWQISSLETFEAHCLEGRRLAGRRRLYMRLGFGSPSGFERIYPEPVR